MGMFSFEVKCTMVWSKSSTNNGFPRGSFMKWMLCIDTKMPPNDSWAWKR